MSSQHFKRYRMQIDLRRQRLPAPQIPSGYRWLPWHSLLLQRHADVKWLAFRNDLDGKVFPCLRDPDGCRRLMNEISSQSTFCANATWLLTFQSKAGDSVQDCASIQGILRRGGIGAIQNVGVIPEHRGRGLGKALMLQALHGFRFSGMNYGCLEVTAGNRIAVNLYLSLGFEIVEVLHRDVVSGQTVADWSNSTEVYNDQESAVEDECSG